MTQREGAGIDWEAARASLERFARLAESGGQRSPDQVERVLAQRAERFARPLSDPTAAADATQDLLVLTIAGERYAVESRHVLEVMAIRGLTPLPSTPPFILGIVQRRGHVLPVIDLPRLIGAGRTSRDEARTIVAVHVRDTTFGIAAGEVAGLAAGGSDRVGAAPIPDGQRPAFVRGVLGGHVAVVDVEDLARDPRLIVNEESD